MVGQAVAAPARAESSWMGQRIVMLKGMGEVHRSTDTSRLSSTVGINIVSPVARVDRSRLWIVSTSGSDSGWVDSTSVIRLSEAVPHFSTMIQGAPDNWDAYLRRAEAEHALNQREAATQDYGTAIRLRSEERRVGKECRYRCCEHQLIKKPQLRRVHPHVQQPYTER